MNHEYYLSIVATTRNDNHGGDLLKRTQCFVNGIYEQATKFDLGIELIIVEWNPPRERAKLGEVLPKPASNQPVTLRIIEVSEELHLSFEKADPLPLHQMIAKNVGIKRAKGQFVLATNIDILFSDDCFAFFAKKSMQTDTFYRTSRCDVPREIMEIKSFEQQVDYAQKNTFQRLGFTKNLKHVDWITYPLLFGRHRLIQALDTFFSIFLFPFPKKKNPLLLNMFACGDFTMMAKDKWEMLQGYYEAPIYPLHIDSMLLVSAYTLGMKQFNLSKDACIYHIDHDSGWSSTYTKPEEAIKKNIKRRGIDYFQFIAGAQQLVKEKRPYQFQQDNWGLGQHELKEQTFN